MKARQLARLYGPICMYCQLPGEIEDLQVHRVQINAATLEHPDATEQVWALVHRACAQWHPGFQTDQERTQIRAGLRARQKAAARRRKKPYHV